MTHSDLYAVGQASRECVLGRPTPQKPSIERKDPYVAWLIALICFFALVGLAVFASSIFDGVVTLLKAVR